MRALAQAGGQTVHALAEFGGWLLQTFAETGGWLFGWLLRNSAHAALLGAVVWVLQATVCRRLPPRWRYGLWLVVVARLLLPVAPESHLSLFNLLDFAPAGVARAAQQVLGLPIPVAVPTVEPSDPLTDTPWWFVGAMAVWLSGALPLAGLLWRDHRRLRHALAATTPVLDAEVLDLLRQGRGVMSVRQRVAVVETHQITSPAISGLWRPRLLLPYGLLGRLTPDEIRFLFLHELAHLKRADLALNWVLAILQILHWFNPFVWMALRQLLSVREEVCDDLVLRRCFPGAARGYGLTLLRLLEECAPRRLLPSVSGVLDDVRTLRQRILWIRNFGLGDAHPWIPAAVTIAVAIVGRTERMGQPWFRQVAQVASVESSRPGTHSGLRRARIARASASLPAVPKDAPRRVDSASRVVETLASAIQQATANRPPESDARILPHLETMQGPRLANSMPIRSPGGYISGSTSPRSTLLWQRPGTRPYPLPPINARGDILRPPRATPEAVVNDGSAFWARDQGGSMSRQPLAQRPAVMRNEN